MDQIINCYVDCELFIILFKRVFSVIIGLDFRHFLLFSIIDLMVILSTFSSVLGFIII